MSETTISQGERVKVVFTQGESVERNVYYVIDDIEDYTARMELREDPEDTTALALLTTENGRIAISSTGLITWEIPASVSAAIDVQVFGGDLFIYAPDGDAIMVCGFDFEMNYSYTQEA